MVGILPGGSLRANFGKIFVITVVFPVQGRSNRKKSVCKMIFPDFFIFLSFSINTIL